MDPKNKINLTKSISTKNKDNQIYIEDRTKRILNEPVTHHEEEYIEFDLNEENTSSIEKSLEHDQIGFLSNTLTPYGIRPYVYADWNSTSRYCKSIEKPMSVFINNLMNYHDQMKEQCRTYIHNHYNLDEDHKVIFGHSGPEECFNKFVRVIEGSNFFKNKNNMVYSDVQNDKISCKVCNYNFADLLAFESHCAEEFHQKNVQMDQKLNTRKKVLIILSPFEHTDNLVVFREFSYKHSFVELKHAKFEPGTTNIDLKDLSELIESFEYYLVICCFTVCYNITGEFINFTDVCDRVNESRTKNQTKEIIMCLDMTQFAPYSFLNKQTMKLVDVVFICPHIFFGGPTSSGLMIVKKHILCNQQPADLQTGSAWFVSENKHLYCANLIKREESAKIENIMRSYLCHLLKDKYEDIIESRNKWINNYVYLQLNNYAHKGKQYLTSINILTINENENITRLPVYSFRIYVKKEEKSTILHPIFVAKLLNDLFGIESCCINNDYYLSGLQTDKIEAHQITNFSLLYHQYNRISLHYSMTNSTVKYITYSIKFIIKYGIYYMYDYIQIGDTFVNKQNKNKLEENIDALGRLKELNSSGLYRSSFKDIIDMNIEYIKKIRNKNMTKIEDKWSDYHERRWWLIPKDLNLFKLNQNDQNDKDITNSIEKSNKNDKVTKANNELNNQNQKGTDHEMIKENDTQGLKGGIEIDDKESLDKVKQPMPKENLTEVEEIK